MLKAWRPNYLTLQRRRRARGTASICGPTPPSHRLARPAMGIAYGRGRHRTICMERRRKIPSPPTGGDDHARIPEYHTEAHDGTRAGLHRNGRAGYVNLRANGDFTLAAWHCRMPYRAPSRFAARRRHPAPGGRTGGNIITLRRRLWRGLWASLRPGRPIFSAGIGYTAKARLVGDSYSPDAAGGADNITPCVFEGA